VLVAVTGVALWQGAQLLRERANAAVHIQDSGEVGSGSREREDEQTARASVVALLSYEPNTVRQSLTTAAGNLTGEYRDSYTKLINDTVVPDAEQNRIVSKATVLDIGTTTADDTTATLLVFVNQSVVAGSQAATETASSVRVHMVTQDDRWLIDRFDLV
jgi:Mce-associated membrane protein